MIKKLAVSLTLLSLAACASAQDGPIISFGVIADAQYDRDTTVGTNGRHYALSAKWLKEAIDTFNTRNLDFVVSLGDLIDRDQECLDDILPILNSSKAPVHYVFGNHDYPRPEYDEAVMARTFRKIGQDDHYRGFDCGPVRILLMNDNEIATYSTAKGTPEHKEASALVKEMKAEGKKYGKYYNGAVSDAQLRWLSKELKKARKQGRKVIIMGHMPIRRPGTRAQLLNSSEVREVIMQYPGTTLCYLAGHEHDGGFALWEDTLPCITFKGMCEGENNRFAIVSVWPDYWGVEGFGDEISYEFEIK